MKWNFDMTEAPRGRTEMVEKTIAGKARQVEAHIPTKIIATDGEIVTVSYLIPANRYGPERWAMFATGQTPVAWQIWPDPPEIKP